MGFRSISYDYGRHKLNEQNCKDDDQCQTAFGLHGDASKTKKLCKRYREYQYKCPATCGLCEGIGYDIRLRMSL